MLGDSTDVIARCTDGSRFPTELPGDAEMGDLKPGLDGDAIKMAAVSVGDLKAGHGSAEYIQGIENQRAMKVSFSCHPSPDVPSPPLDASFSILPSQAYLKQ
jgi:hypothetical protein